MHLAIQDEKCLTPRAWKEGSRTENIDEVYASRPTGNQSEIVRISLKDGKAETAVDLSAFTKLTGRIDTWFALAPDGSIIFLREMNPFEIYSISYEDR